jgi:hypothetical protein
MKKPHAKIQTPASESAWHSQLDPAQKAYLVSCLPRQSTSSAAFETTIVALLMTALAGKGQPPQDYFDDAYDLLQLASHFHYEKRIKRRLARLEKDEAEFQPISLAQAMEMLGYKDRKSLWGALLRVFGPEKALKLRQDNTLRLFHIRKIEAQRKDGIRLRTMKGRQAKAEKRRSKKASG